MPRSTRTLSPTVQSGAISFSGGGRRRGRSRTGEGATMGGRKEEAVEKDQEPRSAEGASEREKRQFFKIKAVKPNLQVCRRKRAEVVKILVALYLFARNPLTPRLPLTLSLSLFFSLALFSSLSVPASPRTLPAPFEPAPRPWRPLSVVKLPHETFLMSNHGDLRLSFSPPSLSRLPSPSPPTQLFLFLTVRPPVLLSFRTFADLPPANPLLFRLAVCFPRVAFPSFVFPWDSHRPASSRTRERPRWSPRRSPSCAKEASNVGLRVAAMR